MSTPIGVPRLQKRVRVRLVVALLLLAAPAAVFAQTDEIQVYDAEIAERGVFNLMIHTNFTPIGRKTADFPGGIIPNKSVNGAAEWAYGVTDWFEQGLYLPVYSPYSDGRGGTINGFKLRELFVRPHAHDHTFFYGVNFEFSVNAKYWESRRITSEIRPIVGVHLHAVDFIFNPIVDTDYTGGPGNLEFVPATRLAYNLNDKWAARRRGVCRFRAATPLRNTAQSIPRGLGGHESRHQNCKYRNGGGLWCDCRGRQVNVQADAIARSELST